MDELTEEFFALKLTLSPLLVFIDEIKAIRRSHRISEESSISMLGLLTLSIKEDVITTVRSMQLEQEKRMDDLQDLLRDSQKEMRDKFYDQGQSLTNLEMDLQNLGDLIARQGSFMETQNKTFDSMKKDMGDKATAKELLETKKLLKHYTPLSDFNVLGNQVSECATKSSLDIVRKDLHNLEKRVKIYPTSEEVHSAIEKAYDNIKHAVSATYVTCESFDEEKKFIEKRFDRVEDDTKILFQKNEQVSEQMKKKFREVIDMIKKRPWDNDILNLQTQISECATRVEFTKLVDYINPKIESFSHSVTEAMGNVYQFEKILSRYDEILLDKASKDDVGQITFKLASLTPINSFKELLGNFNKFGENTQEKFRQIMIKSEEHQGFMNNLSNKFELIRRENLEVTSVANTLAGFAEKIGEKADKSDIYLIYDVMGRKEEIVSILETDGLFKNQLEACVVILHSLCRTMLKGGESPAVTRKQRYDLYRNLTNLIAWINGEETKDPPPHITPSTKSPVNLKTDFDLETYNDLLTSARHNRRTRRNIMTTSPRNKTLADFVNLPPLV